MAIVSKEFTLGSTKSGDVLSGTIEINDDLSFDYKKYCSLHFIKKLMQKNTIYPRFRIFVCNHDDTTRYEIPNEDIVIGGSYNENYQNGQRRTLSFSLINNDGKYTPNIDGIWVNTRISLEVGLKLPDANGILWFKKGVYVVTKADPSHDSNNKTVSIECSDKFQIFEGKKGTLTETIEIPPDMEIEDVINDILAINGGDGYPLDSRPILYHSSFKGKKTPLTISGSSGSNWGNILIQLAEVLSAEIFYNAEGRLTLVPMTEVTSDGDKPVIFDFIDTNGDFQNDNFTMDMSSFVNKVVVIGANINGHTVIAEAVNDDPASPLCYQRIGYRIAAPINDSNITNDTLAQERADYELRKVLIAKSSLSSSVFFNPILTVNNMITYTDDFFSLKRERFIIQSISFSLDYNGLMSISCSNIKNLPFVL